MHRRGHNVKIGNKKKQEKLQENVYLATDLVFQPLFAHCMTPPPPTPLKTKCPITHQWNQNWIQYNLRNQMTKHLTKRSNYMPFPIQIVGGWGV
jgi:hypothetical protein